MARKLPTVWVAFSGNVTQKEVELPDGTARTIRLESAPWWAWLESASARSFAYPIYDAQVGYIRGFMTVRKERRQRGGAYWVVYRRLGGNVRKIYLGRSEIVTAQRLQTIACRLRGKEVADNEQTSK